MTKKAIIRVWQEVDIALIEPYLLIGGSIGGDCANCKELGISLDAQKCPKCGTVFKYIGTRISGSTKEAKRLREKRPDLTLIDFNDFKEIQAKQKARGFLGE